MATPFKNPDTGIYYLRKAIPKELRHVFSGKIEFKKSLGTKDPKKAKELFLPELQKVEQLISMAQKGTIVFSAKQSRALAGMWLKQALEEDEHTRDTKGSPEADVESHPDYSPYDAAVFRLEDSREFTQAEKERWVIDDIQRLLEDFGLILPPKDSEGYSFLISEFLSAKYQYYSVLNTRASGQWVSSDVGANYPPLELPQVTVKAKPKAIKGGTSLSDLLDKYRGEGLITEKTADDYRGTLKGFDKVVGNIPVEAITIEHIRAYREHLINKGDDLAPATKNRKLGAVKSLLNFAIEKGLIDSNPAANIKIRSKESSKGSKLPFTQDDIKCIFSSKVFTDNYRPRAGGGEAAYWLPYMALYSGARLEEMGQLRVDDIQEFEGVPFIEFTTEMDEEGSTRSIKTKAGKRIIPIQRPS